MEYTHKALIKAGYVREAPDKYRGEGWIRYIPKDDPYFEDSSPASRWHDPKHQVVFIINDAVVSNHMLAVWKEQFPHIYTWYTTPKQRKEPLECGRAGEYSRKGMDGHRVFIYAYGDPIHAED